MGEKIGHCERGMIYDEYLEITERVAGIEDLHNLVEVEKRGGLQVPSHIHYGETNEKSRILVARVRGQDNCKVLSLSTPETEAVSGAGVLRLMDNTEEKAFGLRLPRHHTGPGARLDLNFGGWQMSNAVVEHVGEPDPDRWAIFELLREGPWIDLQRHFWLISGGKVEVPTDVVTISHVPADNYLNRVAQLVNGGKLLYHNDSSRIETLFISDSMASGAHMAEVIDWLECEKGVRPETVVVMAPMATLFGTVCFAELLEKRGVELVVCTGAAILDINQGDEPAPGPLYYSPYPLSPFQLANPEMLKIIQRYHPKTSSRPGMRCNWTESWLLTIRAMIDSEAELRHRGTSNEELMAAMARAGIDELEEMGIDWKMLFPYSAKLEAATAGWCW